jgi:phosphatidylglycerophosphate synthase
MIRPGITTERLLALFLLGIVVFTPPFLGIFNTPRLILGVPILYLYLFAMWGLLIALVALTVRGSTDDDDGTIATGPGAVARDASIEVGRSSESGR